jgi:lactate permease
LEFSLDVTGSLKDFVFLISNFINPWIVDIGASLVSMACLIGFLRFWQPKEIWTSPALRSRDDSAATMPKPAAPGPNSLWDAGANVPHGA